MKYKKIIKKPKVYFSYNFSGGPWGGGNQFLQFLYESFKEKKILTKNVNESDIVIFNSHHNLKEVLKLKHKFKNKHFIHRIDGPLSSYRKIDGKIIDKLIFKFNGFLADYTIFLSNWSKKESNKNGFKTKTPFKIIYNQANPKYFFPPKKKGKNSKRIKLIYYSWSNNPSKGFEYLTFLDKKLDFSKYEFSFIGNTNKKFNNIKVYKPISNSKLCKLIHSHDLFIFCSKIESCSNTLLEAMRCQIPLIVKNSSSNPEIFNGNGQLFNSKEDLLKKINNFNFKKKNKIKVQRNSVKYYEDICSNLILKKNKKKQINSFLFLILNIYLIIVSIKLRFFNFFYK